MRSCSLVFYTGAPEHCADRNGLLQRITGSALNVPQTAATYGKVQMNYILNRVAVLDILVTVCFVN